MQQLCTTLFMVILHDVCDGCSANRRALAYRTLQMPKNCVHSQMLCGAHIVHLIICEEDQLIGDVYSLELLFRVPSHRNARVANVRRYLKEKLCTINDGRSPRAEDQRHLASILEYTVRRHYRHIRSRLGSSMDPDSALKPAAGEAEGEEACRRLELVFNGDPAMLKPCHVHTPETQHLTDEEIIDLALDALVRGRVIPGLTSMLPSKSRWGSMMTALERQAGGFLLNNVLGNVVRQTLRGFGPEHEAEEIDDDFRAVLKRKAWRAVCFTESEERRQHHAPLLCVCFPIPCAWFVCGSPAGHKQSP